MISGWRRMVAELEGYDCLLKEDGCTERYGEVMRGSDARLRAIASDRVEGL